MRIARPLLALILAAALPLASQAAEKTKGGKSAPLTVGDFAVMLASTTGKGPALEVKAATEALVKAGVPLGNPKATLSEEKLSEILGFYGVQVKNSTPGQTVSRDRAQSALNLVSGSIGNSMNSASTSGPTPGSLDDCLVGTNHGACVNCCKNLGGEANTCAKFCFQIRVSDGEPQP